VIVDLSTKRDLLRRLVRTAEIMSARLSADDRVAVAEDIATLQQIDEDLLRSHGNWHRAAEIEDAALNQMVTGSKARRRAGVN